jgi:hypothetical protein
MFFLREFYHNCSVSLLLAKAMQSDVDQATYQLTHYYSRSNTTARVTRYSNVNRYGYNVWGLFVPYAIATVFTALTVFMGVWSFYFWGKVPESRPQDFITAAQEDGLSDVFAYKNSIQAYKADGHVYIRQSRTQSGFSDF